MDLLISIGQTATDARWRLSGAVLREQGGVVDGLLAAGWRRQQVRQALTGEPLPPVDAITTSAAAVIAWRLRQMAAGPVPDPRAGAPGAPGAPGVVEAAAVPAQAADRGVAEALGRRVTPECPGVGDRAGVCGRPVGAPGDLCTACAPADDVTYSGPAEMPPTPEELRAALAEAVRAARVAH